MADSAQLDTLDDVDAAVNGCTRCRLHESATCGVPGEGAAQAPVMFIGEAPGYHEDRQGRPFVGAAGNLLEELLERIGLSREEVFITNVVKHRPPGNRDPRSDEIEACRPFLDRQIELIDPTVIVTLGRFAMEQYMPGARISRVHGQTRHIDGRLFVPMLHPAAALRRREWRSNLEADFDALGHLLEEGASADDVPEAAGDEGGEQLSLF